MIELLNRIGLLGTGLVLIVNGIYDFKKREILFVLSLAWGLLGLLWRLVLVFGFGETTLIRELSIHMGGFGIAAILLLLSVLLKGVIGPGDGILLLCTVPWLEDSLYCSAILLAFLLAATTAMILLLFVKKSPKYQMPFVPFWATGTTVAMAVYFWGG